MRYYCNLCSSNNILTISILDNKYCKCLRIFHTALTILSFNIHFNIFDFDSSLFAPTFSLLFLTDCYVKCHHICCSNSRDIFDRWQFGDALGVRSNLRFAEMFRFVIILRIVLTCKVRNISFSISQVVVFWNMRN